MPRVFCLLSFRFHVYIIQSDSLDLAKLYLWIVLEVYVYPDIANGNMSITATIVINNYSNLHFI